MNMIIYILRKTRRFVTKQGHCQPHFYSKARALSTQLQNGLSFYFKADKTPISPQSFCFSLQLQSLPGGFNALQRMYTDIQEPMLNATQEQV